MVITSPRRIPWPSGQCRQPTPRGSITDKYDVAVAVDVVAVAIDGDDKYDDVDHDDDDDDDDCYYYYYYCYY